MHGNSEKFLENPGQALVIIGNSRRAKRADFFQGFYYISQKHLKITPKSPQTLLYLLKLTAIPLKTSQNRRAHKLTSSQTWNLELET